MGGGEYVELWNGRHKGGKIFFNLGERESNQGLQILRVCRLLDRNLGVSIVWRPNWKLWNVSELRSSCKIDTEFISGLLIRWGAHLFPFGMLMKISHLILSRLYSSLTLVCN